MENDGVGSFALGVIVTVIFFLFLRREIVHAKTPEMGASTEPSSAIRTRVASGCGCAGGSKQSIPIGGQSLNQGTSYGASSVVSAKSPVVIFTPPTPAPPPLLAGGGGGYVSGVRSNI